MFSSITSRLISCVQRIAWFDRYVTPLTWKWRLTRRTRAFLATMQEGKRPHWGRVPPAGAISNVFLLDYSPGFGDTLYINGLVRYLVTSGVRVHVATFPKLKSVFKTTLSDTAVHDITDEVHMECLARKSWDMVLDCSYVVLRGWPSRVRFLKETTSPVLATDLTIGENSAVCSDWVDLTGCIHIGDRWAKVAERLTGHAVKRISPYVGLEPKRLTEPYVYVNTVGTRQSRTLSQEQVNWVTEFLDQNKMKTFVYALGNQTVLETPYVKRVVPTSFAEACRWIGGAAGVITQLLHMESPNWRSLREILLSVSGARWRKHLPP